VLEGEIFDIDAKLGFKSEETVEDVEYDDE